MAAILEYRAGHLARDLFNHPDKKLKFRVFGEHPYLGLLLARMARAQDGAEVWASPEVLAAEGAELFQEHAERADAALAGDDDDDEEF